MIPFPTGWKVNPNSMVPNHQPDFVCPILGIDAFPCSFSQLKRCSIENLVLLVWGVNFGSGYIIGLLQAKIYIHNFTGTPEPPCISWGKKKHGKPWFLLKIFPSKRIHCHHVWPWPGLAVLGFHTKVVTSTTRHHSCSTADWQRRPVGFEIRIHLDFPMILHEFI